MFNHGRTPISSKGKYRASMGYTMAESDSVVAAGSRKLRDLGHEEPGISLPKDGARKLSVLDDDGVESQDVFVKMYESGRVVLDIDVDR
jgi:hypothetical protein